MTTTPSTTPIAKPMIKPEPFLELENVSVARGLKVVLHNLSLRIESGEHVAILGPNGCGKSTLIKTMTCECYPLALPGMRVRIFGRERWEIFELRKRLGVVATDFPTERTLNTIGRDAVITGFFSSSTIWPELHVTDVMRQRANIILDNLEAQHLADKPLGEMSAGEQRRILIGRALVHEPEMLLIDEPSNALDLAAQSELRSTLRRLAQQGTGILLITHHLADIPPEIERVVMMREGKIVADGPKPELLTEKRLRRLFGVPVNMARSVTVFTTSGSQQHKNPAAIIAPARAAIPNTAGCLCKNYLFWAIMPARRSLATLFWRAEVIWRPNDGARRRLRANFSPYVPAEVNLPEFTLRAILLGIFAGLFFGAVTVYVGLRAGLTVSASIPISVLSHQHSARLWKSQHPRKQYRANHGLGRRIDCRWRHLHASRSDFSGISARVLGSFFSRADRRMAGRAVHDSAAPPAHRQGTRQPALSRGHRLRRRAGGR